VPVRDSAGRTDHRLVEDGVGVIAVVLDEESPGPAQRSRDTGLDVPEVDRTPDPAPAPPLPDRGMRLLDGLDVAVVACDERGVVREVSSATAELLPEVTVGELLLAAGVPALSAAIERGLDDFEAEIGEQVLVGRRRDLSDGWTVWQVRDVSVQRARENALLAERARSRFLARASRQLGLSLNPLRTARAVVELATELADAATVVLPVPGGVYRWLHGVRGAVVHTGESFRADLPAGLLEAVDGCTFGPEQHPSEHFTAPGWLAGPDPALVDPARLAEAVTVPLTGTEVPAPALVLWISGDDADAYLKIEDTDSAVLTEFATRAGTALAAAAVHAQQAHTAAVLKANLSPPPLPEVPGLVLGAEFRPANETGAIGGDFYEVGAGRGGAMFALGDVVGKGVEAAVTTGVVRQSLNALRRVTDDPRRMLHVLNSTLLDQAPAHRRHFVTLVLGSAEVRQDGARLELTGGGHLNPLVLRRTGEVEQVEVGGMLVGALAQATFRTVALDLAPGEACVLYSDGVTEARGGVHGTEEFGDDRLAALVAGCHVMPAPALAERVALGVQQWLGSAEHDDIAVLVVQAAPTAT
jgi:hypothetical protein